MCFLQVVQMSDTESSVETKNNKINQYHFLIFGVDIINKDAS